MSGKGSPRLAERRLMLRTTGWSDYGLIDSAVERKLEHHGPGRVVRPEPQCLWRPRLPESDWAGADAVFDPTDEDEAGRWRFSGELAETWPLQWGAVRFHGRFTAFRHLAFFPEQAANWTWLDQQVRAAPAPPKVLNLFGYTGVASLVAAAAGASVTHIDASKKAIAWARENAALSGLEDRPIRWICEDARRYVQREARRGSRYDAIILDPPKYGRAGRMAKSGGCSTICLNCFICVPDLLSDQPLFLVLNAYAERISGLSLAGLLADALPGRGGSIDWGELALMEAAGDRGVGLSFFARWSPAP